MCSYSRTKVSPHWMMLYLEATADIYLGGKKNLQVLFVEQRLRPLSLVVLELEPGELQVEADVGRLGRLPKYPLDQVPVSDELPHLVEVVDVHVHSLQTLLL